MADPSTATRPPRSLVDFVLQHAHIRTNVCSQQTAERYTLVPRTVPDYNLIFVTAGRVVWVVDGQEVPLKPGRLVIVPPGVPHHAYSTTRRLNLFSYHTEVTLPGGGDAMELLIPPLVQDVPPQSRLNCYLRGAGEEFGRDDPRQTRIMLPAWVRLIVLELLRHDAEAGLLTHHGTDPLVVQMLEELNRRVACPTTLEDLAAMAGFSPQHLNRVFRRVLGMTPLQYLTRLRMGRAAALLADGRLTVGAVAAAVGYEDPYYFSRLFKQHTGRSPAQHRSDAGSDSPSPRSADPFTDAHAAG